MIAIFHIVLLMLSLTHHQRKVPEELRAHLLLQHCADRQADLQSMSLYRSFEDDPVKCWHAKVDDVDVRSFYVHGPHGDYRLVMLSGPETSRVRVGLPGGPRAFPISFNQHALKKSIFFNLAREGSVVLIPDHLGMVTRSHYPESDVMPAAEEIADLTSRVQKRVPDLRVEVVATSADALIGIQLSTLSNARIFLLSPPFASLSDLIDRAAADQGVAVDQQRSFSRIQNADGRLETVRVPDRDQIMAFAGAYGYRSLRSAIGRMSKQRRRRMTVVFGCEDALIAVPTTEQLRSLTAMIEVLALPGYGHRPRSDEQARSVVRVLDAPEAGRRGSRAFCPEPSGSGSFWALIGPTNRRRCHIR